MSQAGETAVGRHYGVALLGCVMEIRIVVLLHVISPPDCRARASQ